MKRRAPRPDHNQTLSAFEVLFLAMAATPGEMGFGIPPTADDGKRRASLRYFLERYWEECPEAQATLHQLVQTNPGHPNIFDLSPTVEEWLRENHLPVTPEVYWLRTNSLPASERAESFRLQYSLPFFFTDEGWRPGVETPVHAAKRITREFSLYLKIQVENWKRLRAAVGAEPALSETEKESLRLLALRQAHGLRYRDLAERARRFRERTVGLGWRAEEITEAMARHRVKAAATLIGITSRPSGPQPK